MAKVAIRKEELELLVETAKRAAKRTNSVVVVAEDRLDLTDGGSSRADELPERRPAPLFN
ncbi:MAG: hypothetical protein KGK01_00365 [Bradyrhizobium sp.]|uniref:hypothetical protein n=1 Tax=Bradyrhizobium sp. TaxID=376 RepID=UPI001C294037|nr:hypothetical protein [Bradyrhizobium sp.]MBU6462551.1 hypothetical protein [Pseudomonadota bacterium]MDE2068550.1 hypothetical protein [Bradyrhizobium sp.]MDE2240927.1 hypothetical protein [Bradyrhizobium sp.]MDE2472297.1 hypothetical protein [Bradyrhizobium sp.]